MAKITALPVAEDIFGAEHLPIVQSGVTKRVSMSAFRESITPYLQNWYKGDRGEPGPAQISSDFNGGFAGIEDGDQYDGGYRG